ncbi:hypothetical protein DTZ04_25510 [Escherichia coli]|nr:hypothetical protein [Escherichia coli]EGD4995920.1 hypothetical protein [Escherichia coli]
MAVRARLYDYTSCPDFCGFVSPEHWRNVGSFCAAPPSTEARSSGNRTANHSAVFVPQLFRAIDKLAVGESHEVHEVHEVRTYTISTSFRLCAVCDAVKTADNRQKNPPVSGGRQSQFPDDSCFEVLLYPLNLPQEHSKNNSDDGTGCVIV